MPKPWKVICQFLCTGMVIGALFARRAFRQYPSVEYGESIPLPADWRTPGEWKGLSLWTEDYPPR